MRERIEPAGIPSLHRGEEVNKTTTRLVVGISGATGSVYGVRLLELLQNTEVETHLVLSKWGARTLIHETAYSVEQVQQMATHCYASEDVGAPISSGSFVTAGMVVCPCSVRSLAAIAHGHGDTLIHRAADVTLKERRRLVLVVREAPFNEIHLENMLKLSRMGVVIFPPVPAFYNQPKSIAEIVDQSVMRILDQFSIHLPAGKRWDGKMSTGRRACVPKEKTKSAP